MLTPFIKKKISVCGVWVWDGVCVCIHVCVLVYCVGGEVVLCGGVGVVCVGVFVCRENGMHVVCVYVVCG